MPLFTIIGTDAPNTHDKRMNARPKHVERLNALNALGQLVLAGPFPTDHSEPPTGFTGSLLVVDFATRALLDEWLKEEPYVLEGVYASVDIKPFRKVLP